MPHQQYYLELSEQLETDELPAVSLDSSTSVVVGLRLGSIQLYLMDRNLKKDTIQDFSVINVVEPAYIRESRLCLTILFALILDSGVFKHAY